MSSLELPRSTAHRRPTCGERGRSSFISSYAYLRAAFVLHGSKQRKSRQKAANDARSSVCDVSKVLSLAEVQIFPTLLQLLATDARRYSIHACLGAPFSPATGGECFGSSRSRASNRGRPTREAAREPCLATTGRAGCVRRVRIRWRCFVRRVLTSGAFARRSRPPTGAKPDTN